MSSIRYQNCPEVALEYQQEAAITYFAGRMSPDEAESPNMIDIETLRQAGIKQFAYDQIRSEAGLLIEEALSLFPLPQIKQAV